MAGKVRPAAIAAIRSRVSVKRVRATKRAGSADAGQRDQAPVPQLRPEEPHERRLDEQVERRVVGDGVRRPREVRGVDALEVREPHRLVEQRALPVVEREGEGERVPPVAQKEHERPALRQEQHGRRHAGGHPPGPRRRRLPLRRGVRLVRDRRGPGHGQALVAEDERDQGQGDEDGDRGQEVVRELGQHGLEGPQPLLEGRVLGEEVLVPGEDERQDGGGEHPGGDHGQHDAPERAGPAPVRPGGLPELGRKRLK
jgi:hypothetical protein